MLERSRKYSNTHWNQRIVQERRILLLIPGIIIIGIIGAILQLFILICGILLTIFELTECLLYFYFKILFGVSLRLTQILVNLYAASRIKHFSPREMLFYGYLRYIKCIYSI